MTSFKVCAAVMLSSLGQVDHREIFDRAFLVRFGTFGRRWFQAVFEQDLAIGSMDH